jgi:hypothetical protein
MCANTIDATEQKNGVRLTAATFYALQGFKNAKIDAFV